MLQIGLHIAGQYPGDPLNKLAPAIGLLMVATLLSGCAQVEAGAATEKPSSSPSPMTISEAGNFYLKYICASNKASDGFSKISDPMTKAQVPVAVKTAKEYRKALLADTEAFTDPSTIWPEAVREDIEELSDGLYQELGAVGPLTQATTVDEVESGGQALYAALSESTTAGVGQKIRAKLDLPTDTKESCS